MRLIDIDDISLRKTIACGGLSAKALWRRIQQQPTIDAVSEWIPCEERLPSEKEVVLICDRSGNRFVGKLIRTDTGYKWSIPLFVVWMDVEDGDAWMPLPKPYGRSDT